MKSITMMLNNTFQNKEVEFNHEVKVVILHILKYIWKSLISKCAQSKKNYENLFYVKIIGGTDFNKSLEN